MKNKLMIAGFLGLAVLLVAAGAEAGRGRGGRGGFGQKDGIGPRMAQELGLSQAQLDQIEDLADARRESDAKVVEQLRALREELHAEWMSDTPREKVILSLHKKMDPLRAELRVSHVRFRLDVLDVLTPDQRAKLQQLRKDRFERRDGSRRGAGAGMGPGRGGRPGAGRRGGQGGF
jgi:Spy/CpxP family protein refolding chaperone